MEATIATAYISDGNFHHARMTFTLITTFSELPRRLRTKGVRQSHTVACPALETPQLTESIVSKENQSGNTGQVQSYFKEQLSNCSFRFKAFSEAVPICVSQA